MAGASPVAAVALPRRRFCLGGLAALALAACTKPPAGPRAGDPMPPLSFLRLDGAAASLAEYAGKPMVINLWATWCAPCRAEMPSLQRLADSFPEGRLAVIAITVDDDLNLVREFLLRHAIRIAVFADRPQPAVRTRLGVKAYPSTWLVRSDGRIAEIVNGERDWAAAGTLAHVADLLGVEPRA